MQLFKRYFLLILLLNTINHITATERTTTGTPATISVDNGLVAFVDNDSIKLGGNHNIVTSGGVTIRAIDLAGFNSTFTVGHITSLGSVGDSVGAGKLVIKYNAGVDLEITGTSGSGASTIAANDYSALQEIDFNNVNNSVFKINNIPAIIGFNFKSTGGNNGTIEANNDATLTGIFSSVAGTKVKDIKLSDDNTLIVDSDLYLSNNVISADRSVLTVAAGRSINVNQIILGGDEDFSTLNLENGSILNSNVIWNSVDGFWGIVNINGASTLNNEINVRTGNVMRESFVNFTSNNTAHRSSIKGNIVSDNITMAGSKIGIDIPVATFSGKSVATNTIFDLGYNALKLNVDNSTIIGNPVFNISFNGANGGHLITDTKNIDFSAAGGVTINLTDTSPMPGAAGRQFTVFSEVLNGGTTTLPANNIVTLNVAPRAYVTWNYSNGVLTQTLLPIPPAPVLVPPVLVEDAEVILNSDAAEDLLNELDQKQDPAEIINRLQSDAIALGGEPTNVAAESTSAMITASIMEVNKRASNFLEGSLNQGIASGDSDRKYGFWIAPYIGGIWQGKTASNPGYRSSFFGTIIGVDTLVDDYTSLGFAFNLIRNVINHRDSNYGDRTAINALILSLYGHHEFQNNIFLQAVVSLGKSSILNKEIRKSTPTNLTALADYNQLSFHAELIAGYPKLLSENSLIVPFIGVASSHLGNFTYIESGAEKQNLTVNKWPFNKFEILGGLKLNFEYKIEDFAFTPELHGTIRYDLINKPMRLTSKLPGSKEAYLPPKTTKHNDVSYLVGGGFTIRKTNFDYGIYYDLRLAEKYISHQATIKIRRDI